jgi:hypothetical protein
MAKLIQHRYALTLAIGLITAASSAAARIADVEIYDRTRGTVLTQYHHAGETYVIGQPGHEYEIRVQSAAGGRTLAVMSVDGINILSGRTAATTQSGYVIDPYGRARVAGWRKSESHTASFYFTSLGDSYAARTGRADQVGVIGVALFRERDYPEHDTYSGPVSGIAKERGRAEAPASPAPSSQLGDSSQRSSESLSKRAAPGAPLGTGHGRWESAPISYTEFVRASRTPEQVVTIRYDSHANLVAQGVITARRYAQPQPFPRSSGAFGFVPDPRW